MRTGIETGITRVDEWIAEVEAVLYDRLEDWPIDCTHPPQGHWSEGWVGPRIRGEPDGWLEWEQVTRELFDAKLAERPRGVPQRAMRYLERERDKCLRHPLTMHESTDEEEAREAAALERRARRSLAAR